MVTPNWYTLQSRVGRDFIVTIAVAVDVCRINMVNGGASDGRH